MIITKKMNWVIVPPETAIRSFCQLLFLYINFIHRFPISSLAHDEESHLIVSQMELPREQLTHDVISEV